MNTSPFQTMGEAEMDSTPNFRSEFGVPELLAGGPVPSQHHVAVGCLSEDAACLRGPRHAWCRRLVRRASCAVRASASAQVTASMAYVFLKVVKYRVPPTATRPLPKHHLFGQLAKMNRFAEGRC